jgi:5-methylcytosine-specific restriction endonuclease McrA
MRICESPDCEKAVWARNKCALHYKKWYVPNHPKSRKAKDGEVRRSNRWREINDRKPSDAKYRELHRDECNQRTYSNRAMREQYFVEEVDRKIVFNRDKGICHLCKDEVDSNNWHLDHIMPVSRGGLHCYDNVAVSHSSCNLKKGNKINTFG